MLRAAFSMVTKHPMLGPTAGDTGGLNVGGMMRRKSHVRNSHNTPAVISVLVVSVVLLVSSCSLLPRPVEEAAVEKNASVSVEFPGAPDAKAVVKPVKIERVMQDAVPAGAKIHQAADLSMVSGLLPEGGAEVTIRLDEPIGEGAFAAVAHWDEEAGEWEPLPSGISEDRMTISSHVDHFSIKGVIEWLGEAAGVGAATIQSGADAAFNGLSKWTGNMTDAPTCSWPAPSWSDVSFLDDKNGPVLWCVGSDEANKDIIEIRLKMNRASAGSVTTAIKPAWAWGDIWKSTGPETWASMGMGADVVAAGFAETYLIQPLGEYRFRFNKQELFDLWSGGHDGPLIEVSSSAFHVAAGLIYDVFAEEADGALAGVTAMMAVGECAVDLKSQLEAAGGEGLAAPEVFTAVRSCAVSNADTITTKAIQRYLRKNPTANASELAAFSSSHFAKKLKFASNWYAMVKGTLTVGSLIGDLTLAPIARQLVFTPATDQIAGIVEARRSTRTTIVVVDPLNSAVAGTGALGNWPLAESDAKGPDVHNLMIVCGDSSVSARSDSWRCFSDGGVWDPCFGQAGNPPDTRVACMDPFDSEWTVMSNVDWQKDGIPPGTTAEEGRVFAVELDDGTLCHRQSGGGPLPAEDYRWIGSCDDGSVWWQTHEAAETDDPADPFGEGESSDGYWLTSTGQAGKQPVQRNIVTAYR